MPTTTQLRATSREWRIKLPSPYTLPPQQQATKTHTARVRKRGCINKKPSQRPIPARHRPPPNPPAGKKKAKKSTETGSYRATAMKLAGNQQETTPTALPTNHHVATDQLRFTYQADAEQRSCSAATQ